MEHSLVCLGQFLFKPVVLAQVYISARFHSRSLLVWMMIYMIILPVTVPCIELSCKWHYYFSLLIVWH